MRRISIRGMGVATATLVTAAGAVTAATWGADAWTADGGRALPAQADAAVPVSVVVAPDATAQRTAATARRSAVRAAAGQRAAAARRAAARQQVAAHDRTLAARVRARSRTSRSQSRSPRDVARLMVAEQGWGEGQYSCLVRLWDRESGWSVSASNPSGAYGIPQALPGSKMSSAGGDWRTNAVTQISWGLHYIKGSYGTPCGAWASSQSRGWY